jgi:hypothetical protein
MYVVNFTVIKTGKTEYKYEKKFSVKRPQDVWLELRDAVHEMLDYFINIVV